MAPLILIATPILLPVAIEAGMDPVQFGVVLILNLAIGLVTPPVGTCLFVGCAIGKIPIEKATKGMLPFYGAMIVILLLITFVPDITLKLPELLLK
ncbi:MAG: TRAP transporter large permease subunit, partial [Solibacillus isronensis]